jgi:hypothetical protein
MEYVLRRPTTTLGFEVGFTAAYGNLDELLAK